MATKSTVSAVLSDVRVIEGCFYVFEVVLLCVVLQLLLLLFKLLLLDVVFELLLFVGKMSVVLLVVLWRIAVALFVMLFGWF